MSDHGDGGVAVDECQRALGGGGAVFAAGDVASSCRSDDPSTHWFQMRLWSQARSSGREEHSPPPPLHASMFGMFGQRAQYVPLDMVVFT